MDIQRYSGVNFSVEAGESLGIIGPNGAGKSTLLLHFNGLLQPGKGVVKIAGRAIDSTSIKWVRRQVGLVFQTRMISYFLQLFLMMWLLDCSILGVAAKEIKEDGVLCIKIYGVRRIC